MFHVNTNIDKFMQYLPFLIPLAVIELGLLIFVIIDIARKQKTKNLNPLIWIIISVLINTIGPILYIIFGRAEPEYKDDI